MAIVNRLRDLFGTTTNSIRAKRRPRAGLSKSRSLRMEPLETRTLLAVITVTATDAEAAETDSDVGVFTISRDQAESYYSYVYFSYGGTAGSEDYTATGDATSPVTFAPSETTKTITITPVDDARDDGTHTVELTVTSVTSCCCGPSDSIGAPSQATVTIEDNDAWTIKIEATDPIAAEPENDGKFTITRVGQSGMTMDDSYAIDVDYTILGTTTPSGCGADYATLLGSSGSSGTVTIPAESTSVTIDVDVSNDSIAEPKEILKLQLTSACSSSCCCGCGGTFPIGGSSAATVTIHDNDWVLEKTEDATEPKAFEASDPNAVGSPGKFTIKLLEGNESQAEAVLNFEILGASTATMDDDIFRDDDPVDDEADADGYAAKSDGTLINGSATITIPSGTESYEVIVYPWYDGYLQESNPEETVVGKITSTSSIVDTGRDTATLKINEPTSDERECPATCGCAGDSSSGSQATPHNLTTGNAWVTDSDVPVSYSSSFASELQTVTASSPLDLTNGAATLEEVEAKLTVFGPETPNTSIWFDGTTASANVSYAFAFPVDVSNLSTGSYDWTVQLTQHYSDSTTQTKTVSGRRAVINTVGSSMAPGWFAFGVAALMADGSDVLLMRQGIQHFLPDGSGGWERETFHDTNDYTLSGSWGSGFTLTAKDGTVETFDTNGLITKKTDPRGNETDYNYDGSSKLTSIVEPSGESTTFTYDQTSGYLNQTTAPNGLVSTYTRDGNDRITAISKPDPDGSGPRDVLKTTMAYDGPNNILSSVTFPDGGVEEYDYDHARRLKEVTRPDGSVETYVNIYAASLVDTSVKGDSQGNPADLIDAGDIEVSSTIGGVTTTSYVDRWGYPTQAIDGEQSATRYSRNAAGQVTSRIEPDPDGAGPLSESITTYKYDAAGNMKEMTSPEGATQTWEYDTTWNAVTEHTNELGKVTTYTIDSNNGAVLTQRKVVGEDDTTSSETDDLVTTYTYTDSSDNTLLGLTETVTDPSGLLTGYEYDSAGQRTRTYIIDGTESQASPTPSYLDNGDTGFTANDSGCDYWSSSTSDGYDGDYHYTSGSSNTAEWEISGLTAGAQYKVFASWFGDSYYNTDGALYSVYDGTDTSGTADLTDVVDQTQDPAGDADAGSEFELLGTFTPTGTTITVTIEFDSGASYGDLIADAICLIEVPEVGTTLSRTTYDGATGAVLAREDALGNFTEYEYDALGRRIKTLMPYADATSQTIDDSDGSGFATTGTWTDDTTNEQHYIDSGSGSNTATWSFTGLAADDDYEVFINYVEDGTNGASDSPFSVYDGTTGGTLLATVDVDQTAAPDGSRTFGDSWSSLGVYTITGGSLTVQLTDDADGRVLAGTVKVVQARATTETSYDFGGKAVATTDATGLIRGTAHDAGGRAIESFYYVDPTTFTTLDDGDSGVTLSVDAPAYWAQHTDGGIGGDYYTTGAASAEAEWQVTVEAGKRYQVFASWEADSSTGSSGALYSLFDGTDTSGTADATKTVSHKSVPGGHVVAGDEFRSIGHLTASGATITVTLQHDTGASGQLVADAIRLVEIETTSQTVYDDAGQAVLSIDARGNAAEYEYDATGRRIKTYSPYRDLDGAATLDDGDSGVTLSATTGASDSSAYGGDYVTTDSASGYAAYVHENLTADTPYEVWITYLADAGAPTDTDVTMYDGWFDVAAVLETVEVDQTQAPGGSPIHGAGWHYVGTYTPSDDVLSVKIGGATGAVADAVMLLEARAVTETEYDDAGRAVKQYDAHGAFTEYVFDSNGRTTETIGADPDGAGSLPSAVTRAHYNAKGRVTGTIEADGRVGTTQYDELGRAVASYAGQVSTPADALYAETSGT